MSLLNWVKKNPVSKKTKNNQRSSHDKNNFLYKFFSERDQIEILENIFVRPSLNLTAEEQQVLNKIQKFYWLKEKKPVHPSQMIRVKFKNKTFDIVNQGRLFQIYEPTTDSLRNNVNEDGQHTGPMIDSDFYRSYIGLAFNIVKNELEKSLLGDYPIQFVFHKDSEGNVDSIETESFVLEID